MEKKQKINKDMTISEVLEKYPKTFVVFMEYGLHCAGCPVAQLETIEHLAQVNLFDLKKLLQSLNKAAEEKP